MTLLSKMITSIDTWLQASQNNYLTFLAVMMGFVVLGMAITSFMNWRVGRADERTDALKLKINYIGFGIGFVAAMLFFSSMPSGTHYISQLGLIPLAIMSLSFAGASLIYGRRS